MNKYSRFRCYGLLALLLLLSGGVVRAEVASVYLTDGSMVRGELTSIAGNRYTIVTDALGTVSVDEARVERVVFNRAGASAVPQAAASGIAQAPAAGVAGMPALGDLTSRMLADPQIMGLLERLRSDPAFRAAAGDPAVKRAIANGDFQSLMSNPHMQQLMQNDTVRAVTRELK